MLAGSFFGVYIKTLTQWLNLDVLECVGPELAAPLELFDFDVFEIHALEYRYPKRIRKVCDALQNQSDEQFAFASVRGENLDCTGHPNEASPTGAPSLLLQREPDISNTFWLGWNQLATQMGRKCHDVYEAVCGP